MIDLHAHLLPGIDDGPETLDQAAQMCRLAAADGCTTIAATPHQRTERWENLDSRHLANLLADLQEEVGDAVQIVPGAEIRIDSAFLEDLHRHPESGILPLGDSRYLLLELDRSGLGPDPAGILHEVRVLGWRPIVAHPELYRWLDDDGIESLLEVGALLQITAMSVTGDLGRTARKRSRRLLDQGIVSLVASDCHGIDWRPPGLSKARAEIASIWGEEAAILLTEENPRSVLENRALESI